MQDIKLPKATIKSPNSEKQQIIDDVLKKPKFESNTS